MTPPIALDPGALVRVGLPGLDGRASLGEVTLVRYGDGRYLLTIETDAELEPLEVEVCATFLDEFLAQARAREADAA